MKKLTLLAAVLLAVSAAAAGEDAGKALYGAKCAGCHGKDGKGNPAMSKMFKVEPAALDLLDKGTQDKDDNALLGILSKGKDKMPAFGGKLKDAEMGSVLAYLRGLAGGAAKAELPGAALYGAKCASCHGKDLKGSANMAKLFKADVASLD